MLFSEGLAAGKELLLSCSPLGTIGTIGCSSLVRAFILMLLFSLNLPLALSLVLTLVLSLVLPLVLSLVLTLVGCRLPQEKLQRIIRSCRGLSGGCGLCC